MVDALSELCFPFLKGGNSAFIAAIASGLFHKTNIGHSKERKWDLLTKLGSLMIFTPSYHREELKIERNIGEDWSYKKCSARFP